MQIGDKHALGIWFRKRLGKRKRIWRHFGLLPVDRIAKRLEMVHAVLYAILYTL
jgi:hypothetical protein